MYKVLVLDLDGTLLRSDKTISKRTLKVLKKCKIFGMKIIIATARPHRFVNKYLPSFLKSQHKIVYNGAEIYNGKRLVFSNYISKKSLRKTLDLASEHFESCKIALETNDILYANFEVDKLLGKDIYHRVIKNQFPVETAAKVLIDLTNIKNWSSFKSNLPKDCKMTVTDQKTLAQITNKGVSKLNAIKYVLDETPFSIKDVVAFGDDFNDFDIIKESGIGVAMDNAEPALKRVADFITCNNNRDGLATFLEKEFIC
jgi:5-amino-6-(5-phospho-D-ribitylamino)uracil phosphatase